MILALVIILLLVGYVAYCFGHIEGYRKGAEMQRKINRGEV